MATMNNKPEFNERKLVEDLNAMQVLDRALFALAFATRQLSTYEHFARLNGRSDPTRARHISEMIWNRCVNDEVQLLDLPTMMDEVLRMTPAENESFSIYSALAEDAIASLAYVVRGLISSSSREFACSARRAYEAADQAAIRDMDLDLNVNGVEQLLASHEFVQRELGRQVRDLALLRLGKANEVREFAATEYHLLPSEVKPFHGESAL